MRQGSVAELAAIEIQNEVARRIAAGLILRDFHDFIAGSIDDLLIDIDRLGPLMVPGVPGRRPELRLRIARVGYELGGAPTRILGTSIGARQNHGQEADQPEDDPGWLISAISSGSADPT